VETGCRVDRLIVDAQAAETPLARRVVARWQGGAPEIVHDVATVIEQARRERDALTRGKRTLFITRRKAPFLTPCQGMTSRHRACCDYYILNVVENCPMDCSYCILQGYLGNPLIVLNANLDDLADEIPHVCRQSRNSKDTGEPPALHRGKPLLRIGTGELGDSLALDRLTGLSLDLMRIIEPFDNVVLELKTKTVEIENLLSVAAPPNVVVSWSLNTARHIGGEEIGAASLDERLEAARRCQRHGYRLGFHFDPLIHSPNWKEEYRALVATLFDSIDPSRVVWISLGALRFPPAMKRTIEERFPQSTITCGEMVPSWDGKLRYFRPIRAAMYRAMAEWIAERAPDVAIYLCMESSDLWEDVFGWTPRGVSDVAERLNAGCWKTELAGGAVRPAARSA
jgi:spore photoproduct lyase